MRSKTLQKRVLQTIIMSNNRASNVPVDWNAIDPADDWNKVRGIGNNDSLDGLDEKNLKASDTPGQFTTVDRNGRISTVNSASSSMSNLTLNSGNIGLVDFWKEHVRKDEVSIGSFMQLVFHYLDLDDPAELDDERLKKRIYPFEVQPTIDFHSLKAAVKDKDINLFLKQFVRSMKASDSELDMTKLQKRLFPVKAKSTIDLFHLKKVVKDQGVKAFFKQFVRSMKGDNSPSPRVQPSAPTAPYRSPKESLKIVLRELGTDEPANEWDPSKPFEL
jgi:hypothetical protein